MLCQWQKWKLSILCFFFHNKKHFPPQTQTVKWGFLKIFTSVFQKKQKKKADTNKETVQSELFPFSFGLFSKCDSYWRFGFMVLRYNSCISLRAPTLPTPHKPSVLCHLVSHLLISSSSLPRQSSGFIPSEETMVVAGFGILISHFVFLRRLAKLPLRLINSPAGRR